MAKRINNVLERLHALGFEPGYLERLEELAEELRECEDAQLAVEPVLRFIEAHPDEDLGAPGPLVHFVEEFYKNGYEPLLLESVARKPTTLNVWMLNRLINGSKGAEKEMYVTVLKAIAGDEHAAPDVQALAREFLSHET